MSSPGVTKHLMTDLDGTLVNFREISAQADFVMKTLRILRRELGADVSWVSTLRGLRAVKNELKRPAEYSPWPTLTNAERSAQVFSDSLGIPVDKSREVLEHAMFSVFPKLRKHFYPVPGANEFIQWVRAHLPITLATNPVWPVELVKYRVEWGGVDSTAFSTITHAGIMHSCKPSKHYYLESLKLSGADLKPSQFLHIGNELINDLAATRVGIPVFIVVRDTKFRKIQSAKGELAPAWTGSFSDLRSFLEERI